MKKMLVLMLAVAMVCAVAACGGPSAGQTEDEWIEEQVIGTWVNVDDETLKDEYLEDGTMKFYANDELVDATGNYYVKDGEVYVSYESDEENKYNYSLEMGADGKKCILVMK